MHYTAPELLLIIAAVGAVLVNAITAWRNGNKLAVIEGHVNSQTTKATADRESLQAEKAELKSTIDDMKRAAALLAQSAAITEAQRKKEG